MRIIIPMDSEDTEEAKLVRALEATVWTQLLVEEGKLIEVNHSKTYDGFENFSEAVVLMDATENPMPFIELSMITLMAPLQRSVEDIVEAYLFRELQDFPY